MILPIIAYGSDILRKVCAEIDKNYPELEKILSDMWETMYYTNGVGLAAPQVNKSLRIFIIDSAQIFASREEDDEDYSDNPGEKLVFINPEIIETSGDDWAYQEGCLSIPKIREDVMRKQLVSVSFYDEKFVHHQKTFSGITARVILHEYDHINGKLFIDYLTPLKKKLLQRKLIDITKGKISVDYRMTFPKK